MESGTGKSLRHRIASGWMPIARNSLTLCWVGLVFNSLGGGQVGKQGQVDIVNVVAANVVSDLANGFQKRKPLDVSHRAAHFHHHDVDVLSLAKLMIRCLITLVTWGTAWMVPPRKSPRRSLPIRSK